MTPVTIVAAFILVFFRLLLTLTFYAASELSQLAGGDELSVLPAQTDESQLSENRGRCAPFPMDMTYWLRLSIESAPFCSKRKLRFQP